MRFLFSCGKISQKWLQLFLCKVFLIIHTARVGCMYDLQILSKIWYGRLIIKVTKYWLNTRLLSLYLDYYLTTASFAHMTLSTAEQLVGRPPLIFPAHTISGIANSGKNENEDQSLLKDRSATHDSVDSCTLLLRRQKEFGWELIKRSHESKRLLAQVNRNEFLLD